MPEVTKLTGDIWNRMTPAEREQLGIKAKLDAATRGERWIGLFGEEKRALIREFKKEQLEVKPPAVEEVKEGGNPMTTGLGVGGEPRMGNPKQERERAATHYGVKAIEVTPEMIQKLPPRGAGLLAQRDIDLLAEAIANKIKEGKFEEDTGAAILILHSIPSSHGSPGIMVDPDIAARTPCKCYNNICFSRGIIGALSEAQREAYCPMTEHVTSPGMTRRLENWQEAVDVCKGEIEKFEKGERLEPWLSCMGRELPVRGIEI